MKGLYQQFVFEKYLKTMIEYAIFKTLISPLLYGTPFHTKRNTSVLWNTAWETLL
jgi:hypothetical protein